MHNRREGARVALKLTACVRNGQLGEEVVVTEDVSRGGFSFESSKHYGGGCLLEVAVPYSKGAGNIFAPARIAHSKAVSGEAVTLYGVSYIRAHKAWPGR